MTDLPEGYVLEEDYEMPDPATAWNVADLIEILSDYPKDAIVWVDRSPVFSKYESGKEYFEADSVVAPIEVVNGHNGMVVIG